MSERQTASLAEQAYARLRHEILTCILSPGQVVSERELARQYEVSKTPIREALSQVCHDGLMQRLPGRGYMVAPITIKDVRDLFDLRLILETTAAERAAQHPESAQIVALKEMSSVSYRLDDPKSHVMFLKTNRDFHLALAEAAGNRRLVKTMEGLMVEMDRLFHLGLRLRDSSIEMKQEHQQVVATLEMGDVEGVRDAIARQINTSRDRILEAIMQGDIQPVQVGG
ncbi:MAG: GntR family transcriptional regulator [Chloroflexi bacterium]|nr:GntR family transcriptional regulator [Chloroflexota bacterium]